jgi:hypothetical protein
VTLRCGEARALLAGRAAGLDEAARMTLEEHLAGCAGCLADARRLDTVSALLASDEPSLPAAARRRALEGAFDAAGAGAAARNGAAGAGVKVGRRRLAIGAGVAIALAAAALLVLLPAVSEEQPTAGPVLEGDVRPGPGGLHATERGGRLRIGRATLTLREESAVRIVGPGEVALVEGAVLCDVARGEGTFRVTTPRFVVRVLGTRFEVDAGSVRVDRGRVEVSGPDGTVLAAHLTAGARWELADATAAHVGPAPAHAESAADDDGSAAGSGAGSVADHGITAGESEAGSVSTTGADPRSGGASPPPARRGAPPASDEATRDAPSVTPAAAGDGAALSERLRLARARIARREVAAARAEIAAVLASGPSQAQAVEARTLLAEAAFVSGNRAEAVRLYLDVARRYDGLPAAENALYAAGRASRGEQARALFRRYLERHPRGRFRAEVEARLQRLDPE